MIHLVHNSCELQNDFLDVMVSMQPLNSKCLFERKKYTSRKYFKVWPRLCICNEKERKKIFWKRTSSLFKKKSFEFQHMQFSDQRPLLLLRLYKKSFMFRKNAILVFVSWYDVVQYMNYARGFTFTWKFVDFREIGEITKL